jgi:hypothetical protein
MRKHASGYDFKSFKEADASNEGKLGDLMSFSSETKNELAQIIPDQYDLTRSKPTRGKVISKAILGGLHHSYSHTTYLK